MARLAISRAVPICQKLTKMNSNFEESPKLTVGGIFKKYPAIFIIGIGAILDDGYPHEMRAADYDDWVSPTIKKMASRCMD